MGIFTRFRDIVSSNINAMLDKAEDPEKLIRLMVQEMEETLIELKASCAKTMADAARLEAPLEAARAKAALWGSKAALAVEKGREDLAREALLEKRRFEEKALTLAEEIAVFAGAVESCREDIGQLEEKLQAAKERRRALILRHGRANGKRRAREEIRRVQSPDVLLRFEEFENRIQRMEAEAELAGPWPGREDDQAEVRPGAPQTLEERFAELETDEELEQELAALRARVKGQNEPGESA